MRHFEKGSGKEGCTIGNHEAFFSRDLYTIGKLWTKFQLYKKFPPEIIQFDRTSIFSFPAEIRTDSNSNLIQIIVYL